MRFVFTCIVMGAVLAHVSPSLAETKIAPGSVWDDDIQQMYQSDVDLPDWLSDSNHQEESEVVIVKGLSGSAASSSAMSIAIREHILPRIKEHAGHGWSGRDRDIAQQRAEIWLQQGRILDRFEQPFFKEIEGEKYPAFTREAIKIDLSKRGLAELDHSIHKSIRKVHRLRKGIVWGAAGVMGALLFICVLIYIVLDRITRGFYAVRFRVITSAIFLASAGLIFYVARAMLSAV